MTQCFLHLGEKNMVLFMSETVTLMYKQGGCKVGSTV